jgi:penicillin-binding protein 2
VPLDTAALKIVRQGMWDVVNSPSGTAYTSARVPGADVAGKTGTVQVIAQAQRTKAEALPFKYRDHAWFTSFAPVTDPRIVVVIFAEHGGSGAHVAAPIAQAVHAKYFKIDLHPAAR